MKSNKDTENSKATDAVSVILLLTLNICLTPFFSVFIVDFDQVYICWAECK